MLPAVDTCAKNGNTETATRTGFKNGESVEESAFWAKKVKNLTGERKQLLNNNRSQVKNGSLSKTSTKSKSK
jgi:hypothetical protein